MADAESNLKNEQNMRDPIKTALPEKQLSTQVRINRDLIEKPSTIGIAPSSFSLQKSSPVTTTTTSYPSFTIRCSSVDQQDGEQSHSRGHVDSDGGCKKIDNIDEREDFGGTPSFLPPLLPATISQYEHDTEVKIKAISPSPLQQIIPSILSSSSLTTKAEILDQQQNTINASKKINKCILVNPASSSSSSIFTTSSVPPEQMLDNKQMHPLPSMTIPIQINSSNTSTSTLITKPSSSTSFDQTSPLSSLAASLQNKIYQVPPLQPPLIYHPTNDHSHYLSSQQSLSTPSSLSSSKINLNDTTPSDFVPGIFLDNNINTMQNDFGRSSCSGIGSSNTSHTDVTSSSTNFRGGIINFDDIGSSMSGAGISNIDEAVQQFQSTNPFYNCDTNFKRDEFLKATMRICLVVSPPTSKLQVGAAFKMNFYIKPNYFQVKESIEKKTAMIIFISIFWFCFIFICSKIKILK